MSPFKEGSVDVVRLASPALLYFIYIYPMALQPNAGHGLLNLEASTSHTTTHHSQCISSGRVISPSQRSLPDNTQHSQQTNIHAPGRTGTHNPSRRVAADPCLRPRGFKSFCNISFVTHLPEDGHKFGRNM
jgi:hypothetical protein